MTYDHTYFFNAFHITIDQIDTFCVWKCIEDHIENLIDFRLMVEPQGAAIAHEDRNPGKSYNLCIPPWFLKHHCGTIDIRFQNTSHMSRGV